MLQNFTPRPYQAVLFNKAARENTLVVLPTGLGKTAIALLLGTQRATLYPSSKVVFVAPTKPLVEQQLETFKKHLPEQSFALFTGGVTPHQRQQLWTDARFIFCTPQTLENDVLANRISLEEVSLLVVDEAHRATGDYAYVFLAQEYQKISRHPRILALTASPGADEAKVREVMQNLCMSHLEFRRATDPDVKPFTKETDVSWVGVELSAAMNKLVAYLKRAYNRRFERLRELGVLDKRVTMLSKVQILKLQRELHARIQREQDPELMMAMSIAAQLLKLQHALDLAQTQTLHAFVQYVDGITRQARTSKVKAFKNLAMDEDIRSALAKARDLLGSGAEHPKVQVVTTEIKDLLRVKPDAKVIIFTQFRDSAQALAEVLSSSGISHSLFFGQAKKNGVGFSQKQQKEVLDRFRNNDFSCLLATSVAEEGLDIPTVDHVYFFEPVPSAIRTVQRRGRTGRHEKGFVSVLLTKGTKDETYRWVSHHKEKRMYEVLARLQGSVSLQQEQKSLAQYASSSSLKVVVDYREKGSAVMKALRNLDVELELQQLAIGDYIVSEQACVEYKRFDDFVDSIADGRLIAQLHQLKKYPKPVVLLEKQDHAQVHRRVDAAAIHGMLATIAVSYGIPVLQSNSPLESAKLLVALARREQDGGKKGFSFHQVKPFSDKELLEYIMSSFPGMGGVLAKSLLEHFGSLQKVFEASDKELQEVEKIGPKKAKEIHRLLNRSYAEAKRDG